jgi:hypothetical protein
VNGEVREMLEFNFSSTAELAVGLLLMAAILTLTLV